MSTPTDKLKVLPPTIKSGTMIVLSNGEYSSYSVYAVAKALKDLDILSLRAEFFATENPPKYDFPLSKFITWLSERGEIHELDYWEWHFQDYTGIPDMDICDAHSTPIWEEGERLQREHATD